MNRTFDICIVGSGITGSIVADHFLSKGLSVVMVERGKNAYLPQSARELWHERWEKISDNPLITKNSWKGASEYFDDLVEIENVNSDFAFHYNMKYGLGGSGAVWSAASWRLTPQDFQTKSLFGYSRDWPFTYDDLAPYYDKVEEMFFTSGPKEEPSWPWKNNYTYPPFKQSYLDKVVSKIFAPEFEILPNAFSVKNIPPSEGGCIGSKTCVRYCPTEAVFRPQIHLLDKHLNNPRFNLIMGAPCMKINLKKERSLESITILQDDAKRDIRAKYFFLAANTIENLRILHNSKDTGNGPVADSSGLLGSFFASHGALVTSVITEPILYTGRGRPTTSSAINTLNHGERDRINAYMMEIWNFDWNIALSPIAVFRTFRAKERHWGRTLFEKTREADRRFAATLIFELEMRRDNKVTLSKVKDKFGLPLAKVDFTLGLRDKETFDYLRELTNLIKKKDKIVDIQIKGYGLNGNHPLGGYVCGEDPNNSVVDGYMRSHDHANLYILGGGAFNSTGALNPTHTIAALALRAVNDRRIVF